MSGRAIGIVLAFAALALSLATAAAAQTVSGTLQGTVTDSTGAALPGAQVVISNRDTGATREITTTATGFYSAPFLAIGRYTVTVTLASFATAIRENIEVGLNQTRVADFQMTHHEGGNGHGPGRGPADRHQQRGSEKFAERRADR